MLRSLRPDDLLQVPALGEVDALALAGALATAADGAPALPATVRLSLGELTNAATALKMQIGHRDKAGSSADPRARAADRVLDDAWGALQSWLLGWSRLPDAAHSRAADARALYERLFPKGLQFLTLAFKDEWQESQDRIDAIAKERLGDLVAELGGQAFLANVESAHAAYGEAIRVAAGPSSRAEPDGAVRAALEALHLALRAYVAQVAAATKRDDPASVGAAKRLLGPALAASGADGETR